MNFDIVIYKKSILVIQMTNIYFSPIFKILEISCDKSNKGVFCYGNKVTSGNPR